MSLNYEKLSHKQEDNFWTSYADLATCISVLFLLLYAIASLRTTAIEVQHQMVTQQKLAEAERLREQIQAYEVLKDGYIKKGATEKEKQYYQSVLKQMELLKDAAKTEKEDFMAKAKENEAKEEGLNQYQKVIQNIINANVIAQSKLKKREKIIAEKSKNIKELSKSVREKESAITSNNAQIQAIQEKLEKSINEVKYAYRSKERSKKKAEEEITRLRQESEGRITKLRSQNNQAGRELASAKGLIAEQSQTLKQKDTQLSQLASERNQIVGDLERKQAAFQRAIADLHSQHQTKMEQDKQAFASELDREKLSSAQAIEKERAFRSKMEGDRASHDSKVKELEGALAATKGAIRQQESQFKDAVGKLSSEKGGLEREVAALKAREDDRQKLGAALKANFAKAGIDADINTKTGEVIIHFGDQYFDYGSSKLKDGMQTILKRAVPVYADTLFKDPTVAQRISSVEIVGFASPTYAGKYIDPNDLSPNARQAVNYNMDLSYKRAKSIFEHAFDTKAMRYPYQNQLFQLTKVTGHSYLRSKGVGDPSFNRDLTDSEYCEKYDCSKAQKVLIKFNFSER